MAFNFGSIFSGANINPTDGFIPYRLNATTFADSWMYEDVAQKGILIFDPDLTTPEPANAIFDIKNTGRPFEGLRLRIPVPAPPGITDGDIGNFAWDETYFYFRTAAGWQQLPWAGGGAGTLQAVLTAGNSALNLSAVLLDDPYVGNIGWYILADDSAGTGQAYSGQLNAAQIFLAVGNGADSAGYYLKKFEEVVPLGSGFNQYTARIPKRSGVIKYTNDPIVTGDLSVADLTMNDTAKIYSITNGAGGFGFNPGDPSLFPGEYFTVKNDNGAAAAAPVILNTIFLNNQRLTSIPRNACMIIVSDGAQWSVINSSPADTYTPNLSNPINLNSQTAFPCQYVQIGNCVTVSGKIKLDPTIVATISTIEMSLPIVISTFGSDYEAAGAGMCNSRSQGFSILANPGTNNVIISLVSVAAVGRDYSFSFTYQLV